MKISPKTNILSGVSSRAKTPPRRTLKQWSFSISFAFALFSANAGAALPNLGNSGADDGKLAALGRAAMISATQHNPTLNDVEIYDYLNQLLITLRSANGLDEYKIDLTFFADRSVNAFALPGGYIGVFAGLVLNSSTESALVSVLAHELAHLSQRHIHRFMERQGQANIAAMAALIAAALVLRDNPDAAQATIYSGLASANQSLLDYSRAHEREADRAGQRFMSNAGFRAEGMAEMFEGLAVQEQLNRGQGLEYLQTHPVTQSRIADAWESARTFTKDGTDDKIAFALMRARTATLVGAPVTNETRPYALALAALRDDDANGAAKALKNLNKDLASHRNAKLLLARIEAAQGNLDTALAVLSDLQINFPDWYPVIHHKAEILADADQHLEAADSLRAYLREHDSNWPLAYRSLSIYFHQAGDELNTLRWRGEHYLSLQNYLAAASFFEQALQRAPKESATAVRLKSRLDYTQERALEERP